MNLRWVWAAALTLAAFSITTYAAGALVLPGVLRDGGVRWGVAGSAGVAVAALAALWGQSRAEVKSQDTAHTGTTDRRVSNTITGGTFFGPVVQGGDVRLSVSPPAGGSPADSDGTSLGEPR